MAWEPVRFTETVRLSSKGFVAFGGRADFGTRTANCRCPQLATYTRASKYFARSAVGSALRSP